MSSRTFAVSATLLAMLAGSAAVLAPVAGATVTAGTGKAERAAHQARSTRITIHGHGYGHGHGMSQYGAHGAAREGKSYRQILRFYYPGTSLSQMRGRVRVRITADTTSSVIVDPTPGLTVRDRGNGTKYRLPARSGIKRWRLDLVEGSTVIQRFTDRWRRYNPPRDFTGALVGVGEFFADGPLTLTLPDGSTKQYRGTLRAALPSPGAGTFDTVNTLTMDKYLRGVIPAEMPASWHPEAVRSQAVAARTYATWSRDQNRNRYYQICDTTACQMYGGFGAEHPLANAAIVGTPKQILTYQGEPAFTQFSSSSGGWTARGSRPYLTARRDPYDGWSGNPMHRWSTTLSSRQVEGRYPRLGTMRRIRITHRTGDGDWGGRVNRLVLVGTRDNVAMSGDSFRSAFGLRSNWFKVG